MSSSLGKDPVAEDGGGEDTTELENANKHSNTNGAAAATADGVVDGGRIVELLEEERANAPTPIENGFRGRGYQHVQGSDQASEDGSVQLRPPPRGESPSGSLLSIPDDTPSVQVNRSYLELKSYADPFQRVQLCPLLEAVYYHPLLLDLVWKAQHLPFGRSIVVFSHD
jgi:hypothetical protein